MGFYLNKILTKSILSKNKKPIYQLLS